MKKIKMKKGLCFKSLLHFSIFFTVVILLLQITVVGDPLLGRDPGFEKQWFSLFSNTKLKASNKIINQNFFFTMHFIKLPSFC